MLEEQQASFSSERAIMGGALCVDARPRARSVRRVDPNAM